MRNQEKEEKHMTIAEALNSKDFENEYGIIIVNDDKPFTFTKDDYETIEVRPEYTNAKMNKRSGKARDVISENTCAIFTSENIDYPPPIGWSKDRLLSKQWYRI